jgi:hypothetical protein
MAATRLSFPSGMELLAKEIAPITLFEPVRFLLRTKLAKGVIKDVGVP